MFPSVFLTYHSYTMITVVEKLQANNHNQSQLRSLPVSLGSESFTQTAVKRQVLTGVVDTLFRASNSHQSKVKVITKPTESISLRPSCDKDSTNRDTTVAEQHLSVTQTPILDVNGNTLVSTPETTKPSSLDRIDSKKGPIETWYQRASRSYMFGPAAIALLFFLVSLIVVSCALSEYADRLEKCRQLNISLEQCGSDQRIWPNSTAAGGYVFT